MKEQPLILQITNVFLRVASLGAKLLLSLYMGRYLGLSDLGAYGLVFAAVIFSTTALGMRLDYVVGRDMVGRSPCDAMRLVRDESLFYAANYIFFAFLLFFAWLADTAAASVLLAIFVLAVLENASTALSSALVSMGRPVYSTLLFFIRAGLWSGAIVVLGMAVPSLRTIEMVFAAWIGGEIIGFVLGVAAFRREPWRAAVRMPVDWPWMRRAVLKGFPIWLGSMGWSLAFSVDRFVVSRYLGIDLVGVITFYSSFAAALLSLAHSGVYAFSYPRLIRLHQDGRRDEFNREAFRTWVQAVLFVSAMALMLGWLIPFAAPFFGKPAFATYASTLWLLLLAVWIRTNADTFHYVLYARHEDRPLWLGALLMLIPVVVGNLIFVPRYGLIGVGYSAVVADVFLFLWRFWFVFGKAHQKNRENKEEQESNIEKTAEFLDP